MTHCQWHWQAPARPIPARANSNRRVTGRLRLLPSPGHTSLSCQREQNEWLGSTLPVPVDLPEIASADGSQRLPLALPVPMAMLLALQHECTSSGPAVQETRPGGPTTARCQWQCLSVAESLLSLNLRMAREPGSAIGSASSRDIIRHSHGPGCSPLALPGPVEAVSDCPSACDIGSLIQHLCQPERRVH